MLHKYPRTPSILALLLLAAGACSGDDDADGSGPGGGADDMFGNATDDPTDDPTGDSTGDSPGTSGSGDRDGGSGPGNPGNAPLDATLPFTGACGRLEVENVDLLFMVDNSGSMKEEQASLRRELPRMITQLTSGDTNGDGQPDITPIRELHLGVVSSDMGLVGITGIEKCDGLGDDGVLQHGASAELAECEGATFPSFLTYQSASDDPAKVASDFACIATLGTDGCGFEQQLEATLKALWPSSDDSITFVPRADGSGDRGHGDVENAGFLRPSGADTSLLAVVLVTDEDDCSSTDTSHLIPPGLLDPEDPEQAELLTQGLNVRCHHHPENLHPVSRYADGIKALRPNSEGLIVFGAITGVPTRLVTPEVLAGVDFADDAAREAFYDGLLADPEMQPVVESFGTAQPDDDKLRASCETTNGRAYPPVRIVEAVREFGRHSVVQSICQDDFGPAIDALLEAITRASKSACVVE